MTTKIKPVEVNANFLYPLETSENHRFFMFSGGTKGNIDPKWVKQLQYRQEQHNLMLFAWNASSSIVKQNDYKNKTPWLTQTTLSKSFFLFHATYIKDIKEFFKGLFFRSKLVLSRSYIKRFVWYNLYDSTSLTV